MTTSAVHSRHKRAAISHLWRQHKRALRAASKFGRRGWAWSDDAKAALKFADTLKAKAEELSREVAPD